jgi:hypothetical protein
MLQLFIRSVENEIKELWKKTWTKLELEGGFKNRIWLYKNRSKSLGTEFGHILRRERDTPHIVCND